MKHAVLVVLATSPALADPPARCSAAVVIDKVAKGDVTGAVTKIDGTTVHLDKLDFKYESELPMPFGKGDTISVHYRCGGPPPGLLCDARIEDAKGTVLVIAAWNGSDELSDGWTAKAGKVLTSEQNPNEKRKSVRRTHELVLARGKATVTTAGLCASVTDAGATWLVTGYAVTWDGVRPPEGIDRKGYSIVRSP